MELNLENIKMLIESAFFLISIVAVITSFLTYRQSIKLKESEWLHSFSDKFYSNENYKRIRRILDYSEIKTKEFDKFKHIINKLLNDEKQFEDDEIKLIEDLADFLNFFELIGSLVALKQLKISEVRLMFEYYLSLIKRHKFLCDYLKNDGFEKTLFLIENL